MAGMPMFVIANRTTIVVDGGQTLPEGDFRIEAT